MSTHTSIPMNTRTGTGRIHTSTRTCTLTSIFTNTAMTTRMARGRRPMSMTTPANTGRMSMTIRRISRRPMSTRIKNFIQIDHHIRAIMENKASSHLPRTANKGPHFHPLF